jgi:hypothetical protein
MPFSQGSRTRLSYIEEVDFATTPSGNFTEIPFVTHNLNISKERVTSASIQSDRMPRHDRHGNTQAGGDISVELLAGDYDAFLESLMFSTWDASPVAAPDELKVGTTLKSFTIEDYMEDIDQARLFTGMAVSQASFSFAPNQMVNTTFSFVGSGGSIVQDQKTITAASTNQPFDAYAGSLDIGDTGGVLSEVTAITSIDLTINNSLNPTFVIGSATTPQLEYGRAEVEGNITAYFEDQALYNRFLNETETALQVDIQDPGALNTYTFFFPKVKFNGGDAPVENPQSRMITIPFVALYDTVANSNIVIYRPDSN